MFDTNTYFISGTAKLVSIKYVIVRLTVTFLAEPNKSQLKLSGFSYNLDCLMQTAKISKLLFSCQI
jgi:hypothetical protein